ncbi:MAG: ribosome silencing factor [Deltaproteobacteria bacterium]|nr:ribosome silencing factor [Deltaproteobacteria bacterium]
MTEKNSGLELACWMSQLLDKKGGRGIFVFDVRNRSSVTDFMIIASGTSSTHLETLIDAPCKELKSSGFPAHCVEGKATGWVVADFGDVILHVFDEPIRQLYNLEDLWKECPRVDWEQINKSPLAGSL